MDFFDRQEQARKRTGWLVLYFGLAVASIISSIYLLALFLANKAVGGESWFPVHWWNPKLFLYTAGGTALIILCGSLWKSAQLSSGGSAVAEMLGGDLIAPQTKEPSERKILNVVEEMALASGMATPPVYLLPEERGINAFAAGFTTKDAVIGVTRGCVEKLSRDEFQGVIAHEFSHILNGDMRLNIRLMGIIFGIICIAEIGRIMLRGSSGRRIQVDTRTEGKGANLIPFIGMALLIIGSLGVFFGRLIQAAVSRQREFLADASAVQFTRNPSGISGALKKIGAHSMGSRINDPHGSETSHLFFGSAIRSNFLGMLATHPPLVDRIRAIEPTFDGDFSSVVQPTASETAEIHQDINDLLNAPSGNRARSPVQPISVALALASIGTPQPGTLQAARDWKSSLSQELLDTSRTRVGATSILCALLLDEQEATSASQLEHIRRHLGSEVSERAGQLHADLASFEDNGRLPLVELCIPALRGLSATEYDNFRRLVRVLIESDQSVDLFEYALERCLDRYLSTLHQPAGRRVVRHFSIIPVKDDVLALLNTIARIGNEEDSSAAAAFLAGVRSLGFDPTSVEPYSPEKAGLDRADAALQVLAVAGPNIKRQVIAAAAHTVACDGILQPREAEILRAVADSLDCPIPPFLGIQRELDGQS